MTRPAGTLSVTTTFDAATVPALRAVSVYVNGVLTATGSAESTLITRRSTPLPGASTVAEIVCESFAVTASVDVAVTKALVVTVPAAGGVYVAVTTTVSFCGISPSAQTLGE